MSGDYPRPIGIDISEEDWRLLVICLKELNEKLPPVDYERTLNEIVTDTILYLQYLEARELVKRLEVERLKEERRRWEEEYRKKIVLARLHRNKG